MKSEAPLCPCGKCGMRVSWNYRFNRWNKYIYGHTNWSKGMVLKKVNPKSLDTPPICSCNICGLPVTWNKHDNRWNQYLVGHTNKGTGVKKKMSCEDPPLCKCGCNDHVKWDLKKGEWNTYIKNHYHLGMVNNIPSKDTLEKRRIANIGDRNPSWQGGKSFEEYPQKFSNVLKEAIRKRDGYICQVCLMPEWKLKRRLSIHHVDYIKDNCGADNLISLCTHCHMKTNTDREVWQSVFASQ